MKKLLFIFSFLIPLTYCAQDIPYVVINEINSDNPGGQDNADFIELYGTPNASLDSLVIVFYDGNSGTSYSASDLDGFTLDEFGFFVIGNTATVNVDLIMSNPLIQNGQDGVAIYHADGSDFPNGTAPITNDLIDAAVYGTGDQTATNLITGLGLDVLIPGYLQLDETAQQNGNDLSLSRIPDGGPAFEESSYVLQEITPGTFNQPSCHAVNISTDNTDLLYTFCDDAISALVSFAMDTLSYGDSLGFVIADQAGLIVVVTFETSYDFAGLPIGSYSIYGLAYSGVLDPTTSQAGLPIINLTATNCLSLTSNFITVQINSCGGCIAGEITEPIIGNTFSACAGTDQTFLPTTNSTSLNDEYLFVITDTSNLIVDTFYVSYNISALAAGSYTITGISYLGVLDETTVVLGADASLITASVCQDFSINTITLNLFACNTPEPCTQLFISEYLEGNNGTKALEIFNPTLNTIDLSGYSLLNYANGATIATNTLALSGTIGPLDTYIVANPGTGGGGGGQADPAVLALADITDLVANYSGNDAVELRFNDVVIDVIGVVGEDPGNQTGWPVGTGTTRNFDLVRKQVIQGPIDLWLASQNQWDVYANTDFTHLGNHSFNNCSSLVLAGINGGDVTVNENVGTITISVQALNVQSPIELTLEVIGGTADLADYAALLPQLFTFDGTNDTQALSLDIIDDLDLENDETIIFQVTSTNDVFWLTQTITVTILANDPNCDGGNLLNSFFPVNQCSDVANPTVDVTKNTTMPNANYVYVVTNANDSIIFISTTASVDLDALGAGTFHIWGLSYTGSLDNSTIQANELVDNITADSCSSLSSNRITVIRTSCIVTGCDAGQVSLEDGATLISVCSDTNANVLSIVNDGQSADDNYIYFLCDANNNILSSFAGSIDANQEEIGSYYIYGVSYQGTLDATTVATGQPITGVSATICWELSLNFITVNVVDCSIVQPCSLLYFSEYIEDSQSNKALEIYNPTDSDIDLSNYSVNMYINGAVTPDFTLQCAGVLASHDVYVILSSGNGQNASDPLLVAAADTLHEVATFNGNDAVELLFQNNVIDVIGVVGEDPGNQNGWVIGNSSTSNHTLIRRPEINAANPDWNIVSGQWISFPQADFTHIGAHDAIACDGVVLPEIGFFVASQTVAENIGIVTISVQANNLTSPVTVTVDAAGTATSGADYTASFPYALVFPAGNSVQSFDITVNLDAAVESPETVDMSLTADALVSWIFQQSSLIITDVNAVEEMNQTKVSLYPNPTNAILNVSSSQSIQQWRIIDLSGREVMNGSANGKSTFTIETSDLAIGQYVLSTISEQQIQHVSFVIEK